MANIKVVEYLQNGVSVFEKWFSSLDAQAAAKVTTALYRLEQGNFSNVKSAGQGVSEFRIDFGPGYRVYFGGKEIHWLSCWEEDRRKPNAETLETLSHLWEQYKIEKKKKK